MPSKFKKLLLPLCALLQCISTSARAHSPRMESPVQFSAQVPERVRLQFLDDLELLFSLQSEDQTPLSQTVFGQATGEAYRVWFSGRIYSVGMVKKAPTGQAAFVDPEAHPHQMTMTPLYTGGTIPQVYRLGVLLHEARLTEEEQGFWAHAICPKKFISSEGAAIVGLFSHQLLANKAACDDRRLGSYSIQTIFYGNLFRFCKNCNSKVKSDAELFARDNLSRIITESVKLELKEDLGF